MSDPFLAEIRAVGFNFAPKGWSICDGQLIPIRQNSALFSIVGVNFGGDGTLNFGLPNLQGRVAVGAGNSPPLSPYVVGQSGGSTSETLLTSNVGSHSHALTASAADGVDQSPVNSLLAAGAGIGEYAAPSTLTPLGASLSPMGSGGPHNNMMPYQTMLYVIAMAGVFPPHQ